MIRRVDQPCHVAAVSLRWIALSRWQCDLWVCPFRLGRPVIKRIELVNFMSHEHTVIEPHAGLTVLVGPNNCGKSAVVTALQILAHNENSTYVLRHEAKECLVRVDIEDSLPETGTSQRHSICWSRGRKKHLHPRVTTCFSARLHLCLLMFSHHTNYCHHHGYR